MAGHVWLARDVDDALGRGGVLAPRVADLAVEHGGVRVDGGEGAALAAGHRDGRRLAWGQGDGDQGWHGVDPAAHGAPLDEDQVLAGVVGHFVGVGAIGTDPDGAVVASGVLTKGGESHGAEELAGVGCGEGSRLALLNLDTAMFVNTLSADTSRPFQLTAQRRQSS